MSPAVDKNKTKKKTRNRQQKFGIKEGPVGSWIRQRHARETLKWKKDQNCKQKCECPSFQHKSLAHVLC